MPPFASAAVILRTLPGAVSSSAPPLPLLGVGAALQLPPPSPHAPSFSFRSSTPSLCRGRSSGDPPVLSVRTVNYFIDEQTGKYKFGSKIVSTTFFWRGGVGGDAAVLTTPDTAAHDDDERNVYAGVEDVRLFRASDGALYMSGTRGVRKDAGDDDDDAVRFYLCVEFGRVVDEGEGNVVVARTRLLSFKGRQTTLEKNWAVLEDLTSPSPRLKMVYAWSPNIVIGDVTPETSEVTETHCTPSPPSLKDVRGSTNGVLMAANTEWWFICHRMELRDGRRQYTHVFVVLDATTPELRFKRHSSFFTFEGGSVEYTLGFVVLPGDDLLIGYSLMDRETKFVRVPRFSIDAALFRHRSAAAAVAPSPFCVNMIVRQEGQIMRRCLDALVGVVSEFAILDTGSTDDTVAQIEAFDAFPGRVATSTFHNFAQARNEALALASSSSSSSSHLLLLDADMVLVVGPGGGDALRAFVSAAGPDVLFLILQCHGGLEYYNVRIVPLRRVRAGDIRYVGVTHEYVHDASGRAPVRVPRDVAYIQDVSDGGCKHDKTERDIRLLTRALDDDGGDGLSTGDRARYMFYLAQSYRDLGGGGGRARARECYRARAAITGTWVEEVAYSLLQLVRMALEDKDEAGALELVDRLEATGVRRPEAFCALTSYYREAGRHADAMRYLMLAHQNMPSVSEDSALPLFFDTSVTYTLKFEASIVLWYTNDRWWRQKGKELCAELLTRKNPALPPPMHAVVQHNFDNFYKTVE
jgi:glycosyltransferase involved in cell wall biosynthesis